MDKKTAMCGLTCSECEAFLAAQNNDNELRKKIAVKWEAEYHQPIKPEDINCVGCTTLEGAHISYCGLCEIRACGLQRKLSTCAACPEYACQKLTNFFAMAPAAKASLEKLRQ